MAIEKTPRLGLPKYTSGSDLHPNRSEFNALQEIFESLVGIAAQGVLSDRPAAGVKNRTYWATDTERLYFDDGKQWLDVNTNGGGGAAKNVVVAGTAAEGSSARAARADHTHNLPLATGSAHGGMSKTDKAKLDAATVNPTADALAQRNGNGQLSVGAPTSGTHATTKTYVDAEVAKKSELGHTHAGEDIVSGTINPARIANATTSVDGLMSKSDKGMLSGATASATGGTLMRRNDNGHVSVLTPELATHPTTKKYVDDMAAERLQFMGEIGNGSINATVARGVYSQAQAGPVTTANGYPINGAAGTLLVLPFGAGQGTGYLIQEWTEWGSLRRWLRSTNDAGKTWRNWIEQATTATATKTADGLMSKADKTLLDGSTSATNAPGALVQRADTGFFQVQEPTAATHPSTKNYVDKQTATRAAKEHTHAYSDVVVEFLDGTENLNDVGQGVYAQTRNASALATLNYPVQAAGLLTVTTASGTNFVYQTYQGYGPDKRLFYRGRYSGTWTDWQQVAVDGHKHNGADITAGTIHPDRIANASSSTDGLMSKADKATLDAATYLPTNGTIVRRHSTAGTIHVETGLGDKDAVNKGYVDGELAKKANSSHKHSVGDLNPGDLTMTRLRLTNTSDASETSTGHAFQIGDDDGNNLVIDNNEIIGRKNGALELVSMPGGLWGLPAPLTGSTATNKDYVDAQIKKAADEAVATALGNTKARGAVARWTNTMSEPANSGKISGEFILAQFDIPDPGFAYHVQSNAVIEAAPTVANTRWDVVIRINGVNVTASRGDAVVPWYVLAGGTGTARRGDAKIELVAWRSHGTGNFGLSTWNKYFQALLVPAQE